MCVPIYVCVCVFVCARMCVHAHTHTHTHTHTLNSPTTVPDKVLCHVNIEMDIIISILLLNHCVCLLVCAI